MSLKNAGYYWVGRRGGIKKSCRYIRITKGHGPFDVHTKGMIFSHTLAFILDPGQSEVI